MSIFALPFNIFKINSIKTRVTAFTLAVFIIGVWILSYYISHKLQSDLTKQISERQLSSTALLADQINHDLIEKKRTLESLAAKISEIGLDHPAQLQLFLEDRFIIKRDYNAGAAIADSSGTAIASVPKSIRRIGINYSNLENIAFTLQTGQSSISKVEIGKAQKDFSFNIAVPVRNADNKVIGVLAGVLDLTRPNFLDKIAQSRYGESGYYLLEDQRTRIIITSTDRARVLRPQSQPGKNWLVDRHLQGYEISGITQNQYGVEVLASAKRIPATNWMIVSALPTAEAFAPIREMQLRILWSTTLFTVILGSIIWWLLRRELSPIFTTIKKLTGLTNSETHHELLPETNHGEIGDLIKAFNHLLSTLHDRESALAESEFRWKFAIEAAGDGLWDWDISNNHVFFSKTWKQMLGYEENDISNNLDEWKRILHPDDFARTMAAVQDHLDGKTPSYINEHRLLCKDGSYKWILDRGLVVSRDAQGKPLRAIGTHTDITERKQMEDLVRQQAFYDALTKLPNRRLLVDRLTLAMSLGKRTHTYGAVLFLDLDNFKPLNDTHGHEAGDLLLVEVANRLKSCVRETDTVARMGGDEFVVVLTQLHKDSEISKQETARLAEKIRAELANPYIVEIKDKNGTEIMVQHHCTASIGVALFLNEKTHFNDILRNADDAMYQAKNSGRNRVCFYETVS